MGLSKNGGLPYYIGVFLEISHNATKEFLKQNMIDIAIVLILLIVIIAVVIILGVLEFSEMGGYPKLGRRG